MASWQMAWPMIILAMPVVMRESDFLSGLRSRMDFEGGSVARARAASVSMIRLTQRSWTALRTDSSLALATDETKVRTTAVTLTVS